MTGRCHNCTECRKPLPVNDARKAKRVTCSDVCRKKRERRQREARVAWLDAMNDLGKMRESIKRGEFVPEMKDQLYRLRAEINDLLYLAKDADQLALQEMLYERSKGK